MKKIVYAEYDGKMFIELQYSGVNFWCVGYDNIPLVILGKDKTPYLHIDDAIQYHEDEIEASNGAWDRGVLDNLIKAKGLYEQGKYTVIPWK